MARREIYNGDTALNIRNNLNDNFSELYNFQNINNSLYSTVNSNSASWGIDSTTIDSDVRALTGDYSSTYTTVNSNSAIWAIDSTIDSDVRALTGDYSSAYTTVNSNSASWGTVPSTLTTLTVTGESNLTIPVETKSTPSISGGVLTLNLSGGTFFYVTIDADATLNFSNPPVSPKVFSFTLQFVATGTSYNITWPTSVKWSNGIPPTLTTTNNKIDTFTFLTHDGGINWFGFISGQNF